ncbi:hypothetical protein CYMTET_26906 [Cymbomonas tetramitiformis]|uniref:Uncharacterized protein n=1 Tax=Cymbomonas tetramitiformis TaxID=36881 RepID=A0AAE0KXS4_9CHLO|nr:hypothetical protein CYMTET_26906 [Cymbomonas tetramitiformis]
MPQQGIAMRLYDNDLIVWDSEYAHSISEPLLEGLPITSRSREDTRNEHIPPAEGKMLQLLRLLQLLQLLQLHQLQLLHPPHSRIH